MNVGRRNESSSRLRARVGRRERGMGNLLGEENVLCSRIRVTGTSVYTFVKIRPTLD